MKNHGSWVAARCDSVPRNHCRTSRCKRHVSEKQKIAARHRMAQFSDDCQVQRRAHQLQVGTGTWMCEHRLIKTALALTVLARIPTASCCVIHLENWASIYVCNVCELCVVLQCCTLLSHFNVSHVFIWHQEFFVMCVMCVMFSGDCVTQHNM